jgi:deoxyribose-phosphate aldolase
MTASRKDLASLIQHTDVNPDLTREGLLAHLETCMRYGFQAAMISPCWVALAKEALAGSGVRIATTINFPQATDTAAMKAAVVPLIASDGADEFDFPPNPGLLLSGMEREYAEEIRTVVEAAHAHGLVCKAMLEFGYYDEPMRRRAVRLACEAGVDWIKNGSGWGKGGTPATVEDVRLMKEEATGSTRIKVSGKVNSRAKLEALLDAGAELCGTSSGVQIVEGEAGRADAY